MINAYDLPSRDIGSESDPYIIATLGGVVFNDSENAIDDEPNPEFNKLITFKSEFPGSSLLHIQLMDSDLIFGDDLIGETKIDLEDRFYSQEWKSLNPKPIETRALSHQASNRD